MNAPQFAAWYHGQFIGGNIEWQNREFRTLLGKAKKLENAGYDLDKARVALEAMHLSGLQVTSPFSIRMRAPDGQTWYEYAQPSMPPIFNGLMRQVWQEGAMPPRIA